MSQWAIVYVVPQTERQFLEQLASINYPDCGYVPMAKYFTKPRHKKKAITLYKPAFPGYVFLKIMPNIYYYASQLSSFLYAFVMDGKLYSLEDDVITELKRRESVGDFDPLPLLAASMLRPGVSIRIEKGIFAGQIGVVEKVIRRKRVRIIVKGATVEIPLEYNKELAYRLQSLGESNLGRGSSRAA